MKTHYTVLLLALFGLYLRGQELGVAYGPRTGSYLFGGGYFGVDTTISQPLRSQLFLVSPATGQTPRQLWTGHHALTDLGVSPSEQFFSFRLHTAETSYLTVLTAVGAVVASVPDARRYVWHPASDQLAFITGTYYEGGVGFISTGFGITDLTTGSTQSFSSKISVFDIHWAAFDENLYFQGFQGKVYVYDTASQELEQSEYRGIFFSPDGQYYYSSGGEFVLIETATGRNLADEENPLGESGLEHPHPRGWLDDQQLVIPHPSSSEKYDMVFDCSTGELFKSKHRILVPRAASGQLVVLEDGLPVERPAAEVLFKREN